jgi:MscS family membrane protein
MDTFSTFLKDTYFGNTIWQYLLFFGTIIVGFILGKLFYYFSKTQLRKLAGKSETKLDDYLIDIIEEPIVVLIVTISVWLGQYFLVLNAAAEKFFDNVVVVMLAMTITWFALRLFDTLITLYVEPLVEKSESKLDDQILPLVRKAIKIVVLILAAIVVLSNLGYDILSILAGLGIGGLAIALAAQDAVKNIIGGFSIFWDKPFQIGDWVEIAGKSGAISEVGLRSTRIRTIDETTVVIPNSTVANSTIENYSTRTARRMTLNIGLTYETTADKMDEAMQVIEDTIKQVNGTRDDDILIRFVNFGAFSLDLEVVYWITNMSDWKMIVHNVNMGLKRNLDEAGVDMAFPTETHYVVNQ